MGSLIVITPRPWTMKQLKPAGSKLLAEDANFRVARNSFSTEPLFVYLDTKAMEKEEKEQQKQDEERRRAEVEQVKREQIETKTAPKKSEEPEEPTEPGFVPQRTVEPVLNAQLGTASDGGKES